MTKDAGILDLVSKDTQSITSSKSNKSADKTAPSLFDSMLQEANTSKNTTEKDISSTKSQPQNSKEEQKLDTKTKDETTIESKKDESSKLENSKLDNQKQENQTNIDQNNNETKSKNQAQSSLLDKLVHEAKVQIQKESIQSQIKDTENNKIITKEIIVKEVTTIDTKNSNIVQTQISTATTNVTSKDDLDLLNQDKKQQNQNSLMDRLLEEAKSLNTNLTHDIEADETTQKIPSQAVVNNIYLSSLNKATTDAMLGYVHEAKILVSNATSIKDVQKGADLLNLGLQDSEVTVEDSEFNQNVKNDFLNKLSISKDIVNYDAMKISHALNQQSKETISSPVNSLSSFSSATDIDITVPSNLAFNIENRIIGAQQQMNSMMSDIARNMYLNYKPPITAFRMHLNPVNLVLFLF